MPVKFSLTITPPQGALKAELERLLVAARHPAGDFDGLAAMMESNFKVAAIQWGGCFNSEASVDVEIDFKQAENDDEGAGTGSKGFVNLPRAPARYPGMHLIMDGAAAQIAGAGNPNIPGISITLAVSKYLTQQVWFDPDPVGRSQPVPAGLVDGVTLFLHEMGHGLGFNGRLVQASDVPIAKWGKPQDDVVSTFDDQVEFDGANFFFHGPSAMAVNDGQPVPLSDLQGDDVRGRNNNYCHVGNDAGTCMWCRCDLMTGYPWEVGRRYGISRLDLAMLKDVGLPVV
jgi:hypothetical protein